MLATITNESLTPLEIIPLTSPTLTHDLHLLQTHLSPTTALYILLKTHPSASDGYAAITYVPNAAPVRQKMLFASTRSALARELGLERFREQVFATEASELTAEGWERHLRHVGLDAPLTEEETGLKGAKDAEAAESRGTGGRRGHVAAGNVEVKTADGVVEALSSLTSSPGTLVQLRYQLPGEILTLDSVSPSISIDAVGTTIHPSEPRYSFYSHPSSGEVLFVYTCPASSKIKERMIYATGKSWARTVAERDAGVVVARTLEATEAGEITGEALGGKGEGEEGVENKKAFPRPKRPGKRG